MSDIPDRVSDAAPSKVRVGKAVAAMAVVLVVDDHPAMADKVAARLQADGHAVETALSGERALASLRSRPADAVVLDVSMPGMSGLDVLRALRAEGLLPALRVIMFSATDGARKESLRLGAAEFVLKEDAEDLLRFVVPHQAEPHVPKM
jgi:CheY-like chemotaxis protein